MKNTDVWYIIYTKSRHEQKLAALLKEAGYEIYLPLVKRKHQWKDRLKTVEVPLFKSYVFIKSVHNKLEFKDFSSFVGFVQYNHKPAIVWQHEIDTLKSIIRHGYDVNTDADFEELIPGEKVMIIDGPLKGHCGELVSVNQTDRFAIHFENLSQSIILMVPPACLRKI